MVTDLHRRRGASRRLAFLHCGCRDPWPCRCTDPPPSQRMVDAGRAAARHLLEVGHTPILKPEVLRALWRRGGADRQLAQHLYNTEGAA
jgi:hypothetical protein